MRYAFAFAAFLVAAPAFAQAPPQQSQEEQRANYCIDAARQRDALNNYAMSLQGQVTKLSNDLKETQEKFDAYKKEHPLKTGEGVPTPAEKKPESEKAK